MGFKILLLLSVSQNCMTGRSLSKMCTGQNILKLRGSAVDRFRTVVNAEELRIYLEQEPPVNPDECDR